MVGGGRGRSTPGRGGGWRSTPGGGTAAALLLRERCPHRGPNKDPPGARGSLVDRRVMPRAPQSNFQYPQYPYLPLVPPLFCSLGLPLRGPLHGSDPTTFRNQRMAHLAPQPSGAFSSPLLFFINPVAPASIRTGCGRGGEGLFEILCRELHILGFYFALRRCQGRMPFSQDGF